MLTKKITRHSHPGYPSPALPSSPLPRVLYGGGGGVEAGGEEEGLGAAPPSLPPGHAGISRQQLINR